MYFFIVDHDLSIPAIEVSSKEFRLPVKKFITAKDMTNKEVDHIGNDFCFLFFCQGKTELFGLLESVYTSICLWNRCL